MGTRPCGFSFLVFVGAICEGDPEVQTYDAKQRVTMVVDAAALSATCLQAVLQGVSPIEVIPRGLTEVWHYLEEAPAVVEWMPRSAFRRGAATAPSLGLA